MSDYFRNLGLWARGIRWLWARRWQPFSGAFVIEDSDGGSVSVPYSIGIEGQEYNPDFHIKYQDGWTPRRFLFPYCTTYLCGTLAGYGVVSLSRAWYERSRVTAYNDHARRKYPFAHLMTRVLNWLVPGKHGAETGGILWGSKCLRKMT